MQIHLEIFVQSC